MVYCTLPRTQMASTDALSHQDDVDTTHDNMNVQLIPTDAFDQQLQAIDVALANKIKDFSSSDPLVLRAVCYDRLFFSPFSCIPTVPTRVSTSRVFDPHWLHLFPFRFFPTSSELTALFSQNVLFRTFLCIT